MTVMINDVCVLNNVTDLRYPKYNNQSEDV